MKLGDIRIVCQVMKKGGNIEFRIVVNIKLCYIIQDSLLSRKVLLEGVKGITIINSPLFLVFVQNSHLLIFLPSFKAYFEEKRFESSRLCHVNFYGCVT